MHCNALSARDMFEHVFWSANSFGRYDVAHVDDEEDAGDDGTALPGIHVIAGEQRGGDEASIGDKGERCRDQAEVRHAGAVQGRREGVGGGGHAADQGGEQGQGGGRRQRGGRRVELRLLPHALHAPRQLRQAGGEGGAQERGSAGERPEDEDGSQGHEC